MPEHWRELKLHYSGWEKSGTEKSPVIYALWECNWSNIITIFTYPAEIRRVIYTTNAIESLNEVIRSRMKIKRILGSDESALKLVGI